MAYSKASEVIGNLTFKIDKLHFKNHKDKKCHDLFNPYECKELKGVNTVICEQTFSKLNHFKNTNAMNAPPFEFFSYSLFIFVILTWKIKLVK